MGGQRKKYVEGVGSEMRGADGFVDGNIVEWDVERVSAVEKSSRSILSEHDNYIFSYSNPQTPLKKGPSFFLRNFNSIAA